jgi:RHS repeat-associated protein
VPQAAWQYFAHTGGGATVYPVATQTAYRNADGSGAQTTSHAYTWFAGSVAEQSEAVTYPTVTAAQNGPGAADVETTYFDFNGRPVWQRDGDGFIHSTAYDPATGAVVKTITDVDTTRTGDFSNLPAGWVTPSGGGLHLVTADEVDALGRVTRETSPAGRVDYTVYDDANHEVRVYPGWNAASHAPAGPTQVYREDWGQGYTETLTMSAAPGLDGGGRPTGQEAIASLQTLSRSYTNTAGQVVYDDDYFNLSGLAYSTSTSLGTENANFYRTRYGYDERGRQDRTQLPTGTIEYAVHDGLGRVVSTWVGTDDAGATHEDPSGGGAAGNNMAQLGACQYDSGGVGDSDLTQETQLVGGGQPDRVSQMYYDWRDRLVASKGGVQATEDAGVNRPLYYTAYDNLGEPVSDEQYDGDGVSLTDANNDGVPDRPASSLLRAKATTSYDEQGRDYREQVYRVDPSTGAVSASALTTDTFYDHRGDVLETAEPGGLVTKDAYDGAGRLTTTYTTDGGGDAGWADAGNVTGDVVLEQVEYAYDADGNVLEATTRQRFHDETGTGALGTPTSGVHARVSYAAAYYDAGGRLTGSVDVGTNGGVAWTRPSSVPARSDTVLVTSQGYNAAGWVETTTDPRGIQGKQFYDNLGRVSKTVEAYTDGTPTDNTNKTTEYSYDGSGNVTAVQLDLPGGARQKTGYVYGVSAATGSDLASNDVLYAARYPDPSTRDPSSGQQETYTVNRQGEAKTYTDRNGTTHSYSYDVLGRPTADAVTTLGAGVDGAVRRLETAYDSQGNAYLFTSYDAAAGGSVVNQVEDLFNGLGQLTREYQAVSGAVDTGTTPHVDYTYAEMAGGANNSRQLGMTYPNGRVINYNYASGLDDRISRLSSMSDSSGTLEGYSYLGLDTVVRRSHPLSGVDQTFIKLAGEGTADAGDQYTGLDRFGRVAEQRWLRTSDNSLTDDFKYYYDRDGDVLARGNVVNSAFSELYHGNGSANGYDQLGRLTAFSRGAPSDTNGDGVPDTVSAPGTTGQWTLDAMGNWARQGSPLPSAALTAPSSVPEGTGTATVSFSHVGGGAGGYTYSYDFDDDGVFEVSSSASASATVPESYLDDGPSTRVVHGRVTDGSGAFQDYTAGISVTNAAPAPSITPPTSAVAGAAATFTASATDPSTADRNAGFTYSWDFGDGTAPVPGASASHTYASPGTYTVTLTATDKDGGSGTTTASITVASAAPAVASVSFVRLDSATQGSWQGAYGSDGYNVIQGAVGYPGYAQVTPSGQASYVWSSSTTDPRALAVPGGGRVAATWYSTTSYTVDVNLTDGQTHGLALYLLDWDHGGLSERIDVKDALSGALLGSWTASSFSGGEYLVLNVSGHVTVQITRLAGADCDLSGLFFDPAWGSPPTLRDFNRQNQETSTTSGTQPTYDRDGNTTLDEQGHALVYDAWGRPVQVSLNGTTVLASYGYDALGRRVTEGTAAAPRALYYSAGWQVIEERGSGLAVAQSVFSPVYADALVLRDRDTNGDGTLDERLWAQQDANWDVTALVDSTGAVVERFVYDPYGAVSVLAPDWTARSSSLYGWRDLFQGARQDPATGLYNFRNREYSPTLGRFLQNDPLGFGGGDANLYRLEGGSPLDAVDPNGLFIIMFPPEGRGFARRLMADPRYAYEIGYLAGKMDYDRLNQGSKRDLVRDLFEAEAGDTQAERRAYWDGYGDGRKGDPSKASTYPGRGKGLEYGKSKTIFFLERLERQLIAERTPQPEISLGIIPIPIGGSLCPARVAPARVGNPNAPRPVIETRLLDEVTKALPEGVGRSAEVKAQGRNFYKRNIKEARQWWEQRTGKDWPLDAEGKPQWAEHPRALKDGGDPLFIEPGVGPDPNAPHTSAIGPDGLTDQQRWGKMGGRPKKNP